MLVRIDEFPPVAVPYAAPADTLISATVVGLADNGQNIRYFGKQWRIDGNCSAGNVLVGRNSLDLECGNQHTTVTIEWFTKAIDLPDTPVLQLAMHGLDGREICGARVELVPATREVTLLAEQYTQATQADKSVILPALSANRFVIFNSQFGSENFKRARVLVSGCGTGQDLAVIRDLGATEVVGIDIDLIALQLARARYGASPNLSFHTTLPTAARQFDLVISRHVVEHIPFPERRDYIAQLVQHARVGGRVLFEFPNQACPVEPHTNILFFHQLSDQDRRNAIRYFSSLPDLKEYRPNFLHLLKTLREHRNISLPEFVAMLPDAARLQSCVGMDSRTEAMDADIADTLRVVLVRTH